MRRRRARSTAADAAETEVTEAVVADSLGRHAASGVLWTLAQKWGIRVGSLVTLAILTRQLRPEDFGIVAAALVFIPFLSLVADIGLATYVVQAVRVDQRTLSTALWLSVLNATVLASVTVATAPALEDALGTPGLAPVLQWLAPAIFLSSLAGVPSALLRRRLDFRAMAVRHLVSALVSQVVAIGLVLAGAGLWALVAQTLVYAALGCIVVWLRAGWLPGLTFWPRRAAEMVSFGARAILADLVSMARVWLETLVLVTFLGPVALGYWTIATRLIQVTTDLTSATLVTVSSSVFARIRTEPARLASAYRRSQVIVLSVAAPAMLLLAAVSPWLIPLAFGPTWTRSVEVGQVLAVAAIPVIAGLFDRGFFLGTGRVTTWLAYVVCAESAFLLATVLSVRHGLVAVAVAALGVGTAAMAVRVLLVARALDTPVVAVLRPLVPVLPVAVASVLPAYLLLRVVGDGAPALGVVVGASVLAVGILPVAVRLLMPSVVDDLWSVVPRRLSGVVPHAARRWLRVDSSATAR